MENKRPKFGVGVAVIVKKDGKVLFGKRKGNYGNGTWNLPGGHLEFNERIEDCAVREIREEVGINIKNLKRVYFTNEVFPEEKEPYVILCVIADYDSGEVKVMEPDYCEQWDWFDWENLPEPLFKHTQMLLEENFNPFDFE
ncbi:MAG: NUDIX domain-containing protein [bacterium]